MDVKNNLILNCVITGEQALLVQCCEWLLGRGHNIKAVVTGDDQVREWCNSYSVSCLDTIEGLKGIDHPIDHPIDYLLSIGSAQVVPVGEMLYREISELPVGMAINFHSGFPPSYTGSNAPSWALLNAQAEHGVCWHEMTAEAEAGSVLAHKSIPIVSGETAFTLMAKCHEAGLLSFVELVGALEHGLPAPIVVDQAALSIQSKSIQSKSTDSKSTLGKSAYSESDRPASAAVIDWGVSADDIVRLVNALDFGSHPNPFLLPRLYLGGEYLLVRQAQLVKSGEHSVPGTLIAVDADSMMVSAGEDRVRFSTLTSVTGDDIDVAQYLDVRGLREANVLPSLGREQQTILTNAVQEFCVHETWWQQRLQTAEPVTIPYVAQTTTQKGTRKNRRYALEDKIDSVGISKLNAEYLVSVFALFLGRLNTKSDFTLAYRPLSFGRLDRAAQKVFSAVVPLSVNIDTKLSFLDWQKKLISEIEVVESRCSYLKDMWARQPILKQVQDVSEYPVRLDRVARLGQDTDDSENSPQNLIVTIPDDISILGFSYDTSIVSETLADELWERFTVFLAHILSDPDGLVATLPITIDLDQQRLQHWGNNNSDYDRSLCVHQLFEQQVELIPEQTAYIFENKKLSYRELNVRSNQLARHLIESGAQQEDLIGILVERSIDMIVALLAVHKAGCAYVPLDPVYPRDRLAYMVEDSGLDIVVSQQAYAQMLDLKNHTLILLDDIKASVSSYDDTNLKLPVNASSLAYMIYTSGSTGNPKGVMVEHRNVTNFFAGMDDRLEPGPGTWLAVTSISFDISVLEIFWTLARGLTVVLYADDIRQKTDDGPRAELATALPEKNIDFGLFYWNVADDSTLFAQDKYRLLLESAKFADKNGFNSVWTPERHFAAFGGLYPNPSVTSAALATITENVSLRAGSCVVPLHSPIRIAEEWAVVDNLSNGRVGISIAAGWAPPDFAIKPENFSDAKNIMFESVEVVKKLWRGETVNFPGPNGDVPVRTLPRPLQKELPVWVTTAGNIETFKLAGTSGANLLTHLLGQTVEEVAEKLQAYRAAWKAAGHAGNGIVTLMLHTFVGPNQAMVEKVVHKPFKEYLKSAMFLVKAAAWTFPAFKALSETQGKTLDEFFETISDEDMDAILEFAFQRYFHSSGLFGTPEYCLAMIDKVKAAGVDEVACLIDFGIETEKVLEHLPYLNELRNYSQRAAPAATVADEQDYSIAALMQRHQISHFQCTPSMATLLASDPVARPGLAALSHMMVGGEAFPPELAADLNGLVKGRVTNMYGPTESTIWSSTGDVDDSSKQSVSIGTALANQKLYILDEGLQPLPVGLPGELVIGGEGVVRGYHQRPELNAERFLADPFDGSQGARMYRTGDLARYMPDGRVQCLGRVDHQVKIRGYRVELGEIETLLRQHESALEAAVVLREDVPGDKRLVAYVRCAVGQIFSPASLKSSLQLQLPDFMVPSVFMELAVMPLTPNGKIDRKALPKPQPSMATSVEDYLPPASEMELMIAEVWQRALDVPSVGVKDNFFDIGGHSLLIIQVLKDLGDKVSRPLKMTDLFKYTTIESLASFLSSDAVESGGVSQGQARAAARKASMGRRRRSKRR